MHVLLIQPGLPLNRRLVPTCAPPMGLMYIAAYLRANRPSDNVRILDLQVNNLRPEIAGVEAKEFQPGVVGITSMSLHAPVMHEVAARVKAAVPGAVVVVGGPHAAAAPEFILRDRNVDAVATSEGEATFFDLVEAVEKKSGLEGVAGLSLRDVSGSAFATAVRPYLENVDSIPFPERDYRALEKFFDFKVLGQNDMRAHRAYTTVFTSRACPYRCIFCHNIFGKRFRPRSPGNVLEEMEMLYTEYGIREFHLNDDCFNLDVDRACKIMEAIIARGWKIYIAFPNGIRADKLPDHLLDLMRRAGVYKMNIGIESGSKRIQNLIRKNLDLNIVRDAIARADSKGIITHGFLMLGFPSETEEEMLQTINFACSSKLMMAGFYFVNPYPNTEIYRMARESGCLSDYEGHEGCFTDAGANMSAVSREKLIELQKTAYRRFYGNPLRMARIIHRIPRKSFLLHALKANFLVKFF